MKQFMKSIGNVLNVIVKAEFMANRGQIGRIVEETYKIDFVLYFVLPIIKPLQSIDIQGF